MDAGTVGGIIGGVIGLETVMLPLNRYEKSE
jgi:hypothetical protein